MIPEPNPKLEGDPKPMVYGIRKCATCKGICHEKSWREVWGRRKRYYCCLNCLHKAGGGNFEGVDVITK